MFKLKFYNVRILEKYPRTSIYKYKVNCDIGYFKYFTENITFDYIDLFTAPNNKYKDFINRNRKLFDEIMRLSKGTKGPDDCCDNMDLELCGSYPLHDMLLDYMLSRDEFEVIDYKFKYPRDSWTLWDIYFGFISFKYKEIIFKYNFNLEDRVKEYACLNCKSIIQDESYILTLS